MLCHNLIDKVVVTTSDENVAKSFGGWGWKSNSSQK
jgi:hypothetical protein